MKKNVPSKRSKGRKAKAADLTPRDVTKVKGGTSDIGSKLQVAINQANNIFDRPTTPSSQSLTPSQRAAKKL